MALALLAIALTAALAAAFAYRAGRGSAKAPALSFTQLTFDAGVEGNPTIAPDGKTFVYEKQGAAGRQLFLQRVDGRSAIALSRSEAHDDHAAAFSPDGSQIAFRSDRDGGGIFVMGATGESVRRLTSTGFDPSWSPDGSEIVFASEEMLSPTSRNSVSSLSAVNAGTGAVRRIASGDAMQPSVSPNGKRVLYWGLPVGGGQRDLYTVALNGDASSVVAATQDAPLDWNAVWASDGKSILFSSDRGGTMNIWRLGIDEESGKPQGEPQPLAVPASWAGHISLSRDGHHLIYVARTVTEERHLGTFDPAKGGVTIEEKPLFNGSMLVRNAEPSPDGQWVAFSTEGRQEDVFVIRSDGSEIRQLTNDIHRDRGVSWAPDGSRVLFYSTREGDYDAWSVRIDGSEVTKLTEEAHVNFPKMSPDGKRLAFYDLEHGRIADLNRLPASTAATLPPLPNGHGFLVTGWSPDGTRLVGSNWQTASLLFVYSLASSTYRPLGRVVTTPASSDQFKSSALRISARWIDNRRVLVSYQDDALAVIDVDSNAEQVVGKAADAVISGNGRTFLSGRRRSEGDIWMVTLGK
jgi:Tol biopolymer transport system component